MQISITARHCEISTGVRQFAQARLEKLQKFATDIHGIHVVVIQEKARHEAEIKLSVSGHELVTTQTHTEAGAAIELAADRMEEQLRRLKDRRIDRSQRPAAPKGAAAAGASPDGDEIPDEE